MPFKRRVFCSLQNPDRLDERRRELQNKIVDQVVAFGSNPRSFLFPGQRQVWLGRFRTSLTLCVDVSQL